MKVTDGGGDDRAGRPFGRSLNVGEPWSARRGDPAWVLEVFGAVPSRVPVGKRRKTLRVMVSYEAWRSEIGGHVGEEDEHLDLLVLRVGGRYDQCGSGRRDGAAGRSRQPPCTWPEPRWNTRADR